MANWGNVNSTSTDVRSVEQNFRGIAITINETGNVASVSARIAEASAANQHNWKIEIFDDSANPVHLGSSDVVSTVGTVLEYVQFDFTTSLSVTSGSTYHVVLWSDSGSSEFNTAHGLGSDPTRGEVLPTSSSPSPSNIAYDSGSGITGGGLHQTYPTPPDPWINQQTDTRYYAIYVTVTPTSSRSIDSIDSFRRGDTGSTLSCTGMDPHPATQIVTITDGTHSDTCTVNSWSATAIEIDVDCVLPPGTYDIQVTDDTGTQTLSDQPLLIESGWEEVVFNGNAPPANQESLVGEVQLDHPSIPEVVAGDRFGVESNTNITWESDTQANVSVVAQYTLNYWFWDDSTGTLYTGSNIIIGERPVLTNPTLISTGQNTMQATVDTDTNTGTAFGYWSESATPPADPQGLIEGSGASYLDTQRVTAVGTLVFNATGLAAGTLHYCHYLHDNSGSRSEILTSAGVTTDSPPADTTPPVFTLGPIAANPTISGHDIQSTLDEDGTIYAIRLPNGAIAPSSPQVKAGLDSTGLPALESHSVATTGSVQVLMTFNGGLAGTAYDYYVVAEDNEFIPNLQASPTLLEATTTAGNNPPIINDQTYSVVVGSPDGTKRIKWPSEFSWDFTSYPVVAERTAGAWSIPDFDPTDYLPSSLLTATPFYVDIATGNDVNDGLTLSTKKRSIHNAITAGNATGQPYRIIIDAGWYPRDRSFSWGDSAYPTQDCAFIASGGPVYVGAFSTLSWPESKDTTYTNTTIVVRSSVIRVIDTANIDVFGEYSEFVQVADAATCDSTPDSWAQVGSNLHVNRGDGLVASNNNTLSFLAESRATFPSNNANLYFSNIHIYGNMAGAPYISGGTRNVVMDNCSGQFSGRSTDKFDAFRFSNIAGLVVLNNCVTHSAAKDGINFHDTAVAGTHALVVNCRSFNNGRWTSLSNNGFTSHGAVKSIIVGGEYHHNYGGNVACINDTETVILGANSHDSHGDGEAAPVDYQYQHQAIAWMCDTRADNSRRAIAASSSSVVNIYNIDNGSGAVVVYSTIQDYDPILYAADIATVQSTDLDSDSVITYSVIAGNTDSDITIDENTGLLSWVNAPDPNRTAAYHLVVQVDDGTDTATATVTVNVVEA
jgi:hypothetical protein